MKKKIALVLSILMAGMLFGGCGMDEKIVVNKDLTSYLSMEMYYTEEELKDKGEEDLSTMPKVEKNGKTYYRDDSLAKPTPLTRTEFENQMGRLDENCIVLYTDSVVPDNDAANSIISENDIEEMMEEMEFLDMTIEVPFTIAATNAPRKEDNKVFLGMNDTTDGVLYAVSDATLLDGTNLTISGASEGGLYNKKKTITVNTADGVIKSMGVKINGKAKTFSDNTHPYNVNVCSEDGKYTVSAELFSGTKATLKFTVDRTKPAANVANNKTYKSGKKITFSDKTSGIKSAKLDGKTVKSGKVVKKKGTHKLVLTDKAGNKKTIKFKIK